MAKIGILYIATGRYITFWNEFYKRCEKFFCNDHQKQYFLFTDANNVSVKNNVKIIQHKYLGWPEETLMRFDTFLKVENDLQKMDYIYFFNANLYPVRKIKGEEVFPSFEQQIMVTLHPAFYNMPRKIFTYENNEKSSAYVPFPLGEYYVCGGFNGGIAEYYLKLINDLDKAVKNDLKNGIIAVWHDESHLNRYILDRNPLILSAKYVIPEVIGFNQKNLKSLKPKMILIDKMSPICGGHDYMRGLTDKRIKNNFINRFKWWLHKKRTNKKMAKKIFVKIMGGLGNQMFQYAFGLSLEKRCKAKVYYDKSFFDIKGSRNYELNNFKLKLKTTNNWLLKFNECIKPRQKKIIKETEDSIYNEKFYNLKNYNFYDGYFQTYKYFDDYRKNILESFELKTPLNDKNLEILEKIKSSDSVSLHVRRTDYLEKDELAIRGICDIDYYKRAVDFFEKKLTNPHFFIFSDDIPWCLDNLNFQSKYTFVDINDASSGYFDMFLMKNCKHNIIANSSFSWWGAWLNEHNNKIVIAPKIWMIRWNETEENAGRDLIPSDWIRI